MGATIWNFPIFHSKEQWIHGRRYKWKAWVTLITLTYRPDVECQFVGYRIKEMDAIQHAARLAVLHLRQHYDEEFEDSEFQLIPQEGHDVHSVLVPEPKEDKDRRLHEAATHIVSQEALYARTLNEYQAMHRELYLSRQEVHILRRELRC